MFWDLKKLIYISALAETGNYHKAAERVFTSQPNLSVCIKALEKKTGMTLFRRQGRELIPTECGRLVLENCRDILKLDAQLEEHLKMLNRRTVGSLNVGTVPILMTRLRPPILATFAVKYPSIHLNFSENHFYQLVTDLEKGALDLIICTQRSNRPLLEYKKVKEDPLLIALPASYSTKNTGSNVGQHPYAYLDLRTIADMNFILPNRHRLLRNFVDEALEFSQVIPKRITEMNSIGAGIQMAAEGLGAAFCFESYTASICTKKQVQYFRVGDPQRYPAVMIAYSKKRQHDNFFDFLIHCVIQELN